MKQSSKRAGHSLQRPQPMIPPLDSGWKESEGPRALAWIRGGTLLRATGNLPPPYRAHTQRFMGCLLEEGANLHLRSEGNYQWLAPGERNPRDTMWFATTYAKASHIFVSFACDSGARCGKNSASKALESENTWKIQNPQYPKTLPQHPFNSWEET